MRYEREFLECLPAVISYVRIRMVGEGENWTDVYGETVTAGVEIIQDARFRGDSSLKTIMISIARNKVRDHFRQKEAGHKLTWEFFTNSPIKQRSHILPEYLSAMIQRLPNNQRRVVHYYLYDHRTFGEIAAEFGVCKKTVVEWFKQAKKTLRRQLGEPTRKPVKRTIPEPSESIGFIDGRTLEKLEWLTRFWNSYEGLSRANSGPMGSEGRIDEGRRVRNEIAGILVCGDRGR